jgi:cobalt-zinc-cadmium efflux system outer membrane protein
MNSFLFSLFVVVALSLPLTSCSQPAVDLDLEKTQELARAATGQDLVLDPSRGGFSEDELATLMDDGLSLEECELITLRHQKELQAKLYDVGLAQADLLQAGLLSNPTLDLAIRFPGDGTGNLIDALLGFELLELWQIPAREEAAEYQLQATVAEVARAAVAHLRETKLAYWEAQTQDSLCSLSAQQAQIAEESYQAQQQFAQEGLAEAATVDASSLHAQQAQLVHERKLAARAQARQALARALSLEQDLVDLALVDAFPSALTSAQSVQDCVEQAKQERLDLQALAAKVSALEAELSLRQRERFGALSAGPNFEDPGDGQSSIGPGVSWTIPLFDRNQAGIAKAAFALEQARLQHQGAIARTVQEVRSAWSVRTEAHGRYQRLAQEILPLTLGMEERVAAAVDLGMSSRTELLVAQWERLATEAELIQARHDLMRAQLSLEWAIGAPLQ